MFFLCVFYSHLAVLGTISSMHQAAADVADRLPFGVTSVEEDDEDKEDDEKPSALATVSGAVKKRHHRQVTGFE